MSSASIRILGTLAAITLAAPALPAPPPGPEAFLALAVSQTLVGQCRLQLAPDTVVLRGSLTADTLEAEEAAAQIERQLTAIRDSVTEAGGTLVPLGRTRAIDPEAAAALLQQGQGKPFHSEQSFEVLLPDESGLDRLIDRLLVLGMGAPAQDPGRSRRSGPQPLVVYRISGIGEQVQSMYQACRQDAVSRWCWQRVSEDNRNACVEALSGFEQYLPDNGLSLEGSAPVAGISGNAFARLRTDTGRDTLETLDLPTRKPIEIRGRLTLRVKVPEL